MKSEEQIVTVHFSLFTYHFKIPLLHVQESLWLFSSLVKVDIDS